MLESVGIIVEVGVENFIVVGIMDLCLALWLVLCLSLQL